MSVVDIRVDLPSYSRSFTVNVPSHSTVLQLKQEIYRACPGQPRTDGQRLIWRGRVLADDESIDSLWKTEPRIVHLAVRPSAWSSMPPELPQPQQAQPQPQLQPRPTLTYPSQAATSQRRTLLEFTTQPKAPPRDPMAYVLYQHQKALSCLSSEIPPPPPTSVDGSRYARGMSKSALERNGFLWPTILDKEFPESEGGGVEYTVSVIEGQNYLQLINPHEKPTLTQEHALKVLSMTFNILTMSLLATPITSTVHSQPISPAPHVNQLLQQLGIPPLRPVNNNNHNVAANVNQPLGVPNQANAAVVDIRQIPIRPLLAPLMMLLFRTLLLLYFVAPTRKPIFGILILAWMLYEIWQPIRNGMRNGWGRIPDGQQQRGGNGPFAGQNAGNANIPPGPGGMGAAAGPGGPVPAANMPVRPGPIVPVMLDLHAAAIFDNLANMNIEEEDRMLNQAVGATPLAEPGLGHKVTTFLGLLVTTLHPAIWNRRRVALRRREGVVRTEANARNATPPAPASENGSEGGGAQAMSEGERVAVQRREALRTQFERRPGWIQRYIRRVVDEDWVDESD